MNRQIVCTDHRDGRVTADRFPREVDISAHLLREARTDLLRLRGRHVEIRVANGWAVYRLEKRQPGCVFACRRVYGEPTEMLA